MKTEKTERICAYCEYAKIEKSKEYEGEIFICTKIKKETSSGATCRKFSYDLLKRKVQPRPALPSVEFLDF